MSEASGGILDELAMATLLLPLSESRMRLPVSNRISMTDAAPFRGEAVHTEVHSQLAESLYRTCESRGGPTFVLTCGPLIVSSWPRPVPSLVKFAKAQLGERIFPATSLSLIT